MAPGMKPGPSAAPRAGWQLFSGLPKGPPGLAATHHFNVAALLALPLLALPAMLVVIWHF
jgi:hypothetical protein